MELLVEHDTTYTYATPLRYSVQYLRLRPNQSSLQSVWQWSVAGPEAMTQFRDGFGNDVDVLAVTRSRHTYTLAVRGRVQTTDGGGIVPTDGETLPPAVFLRPTALTSINAEFAAFAQAATKGA